MPIFSLRRRPPQNLFLHPRMYESRPVDSCPAPGDLVSILLVTYNRLKFLEYGIRNLYASDPGVPFELIAVDNGSTDGSGEFLDRLRSPGMRILHHDQNTGLNGYREAAEAARGNYLLTLDDDVLWFPSGWLRQLLFAYKSVPCIGYLAADVIQDAYTNGNKRPPEEYEIVDYPQGFSIEFGPTGGWCSLTSREVYEKTPGFPMRPGERYFMVDGFYNDAIREAGYTSGILKGLCVYHATGIHCNRIFYEQYRDKYASIGKRRRAFLMRLRAKRGFLEYFEKRYCR